MRLLHFDGEKLVSTDFRGKTIPPYAILSHRWGDFEVLFEDLGKGDYKEKGGYRKIEFCAEQAAQDQLQYFWIDTCCIDKWDLRERSKAINSMFRWYKNAARCYVFLPDVSAATDAPQSAWEASFQASAWFTRGWTMQELIAPASVEFFSREGRRIGDKKSLEPLVHEVTGIPLKALRNGPLDEFTVDERRDWARNRETYEEEDRVYCLLGILDIVMTAAYGEGVEKAWRRLEIELETAGSAPSIIPFSQNDQFVGRESQLAKLKAMLFGRKRATTKIAIMGPAGIGKSQLALEVAHSTRQRDKNWSVFWIDASDVDSLYRSYTSIAQKLDIPGWDDNKADVRQLVKAYLSGKGERQYLLVFDNTDDVSLESSGMSAGATHLSDYLPQSERCSIIYTTTNRDMAKRLAEPNVVELKEMTSSTAQEMLENHLRISLLGIKQQEAQLLLHELSYLPLAIVQATAYINTRNITIQEYRSQVDRQREAILERSSELTEDGPQEYNTTGPVTTTLLISLDQIRGDGELATDYLFLAACVDRKDIPLDLLPASSPREREGAIKVLDKYRLITRRPAESSLDLHQLVHRGVREWLKKQKRLDEQTRNAIRQLDGVFPGGDRNSRSKWRRLLPHSRYVLSHSPTEQEGEDRSSLAWKSATALYNDGRWTEAEQLFVQQLFVQVIETSSRVLGDEHPSTLTSMNNLAFTFKSLGKVEQAFSLMKDCCRLQEEVLGPHHPDTVSSQEALAAWRLEAVEISE
ncbi:HET-domain-containing protein [Polyplosphaeria fusca]|uniref:HET-domain-containing protein n=1 Tax=Polyplosphaeria fusca TaxID=682080 RepID=A0A9P4QJV2_9PLEO|nr:HET-domain-containing protein [Polyplosphaeria fusca]